MIEGMSIYEFILQNADPVWLLQEEMYPELDAWQRRQDAFLMNDTDKSSDEPGDKDLPFRDAGYSFLICINCMLCGVVS